MASACGFIRADEPAVYATDDAKPEVVLEDAPTRVEEAMKRLGGRTKKLDDKLAVIQAAYLKATRDAETKTIGWLKQIARFEVGNGQLAKATEAWTEVLKLDSSDKEAREFFRTIGRLDVVQKQIARAKSTENARDLGAVSHWAMKHSWGFLDSRKQEMATLRLLANGRVKASAKYPDAHWMPLDENAILFNYNPGGSYIVFHKETDSLCVGKNSMSGSPRYLQRK
ncbi:hypothetical protein [Rosistilla oblonga]|uniref:hypothetical protein n=1 Tax=Rosistilla oblonga TaxID=2527990 RepID=UPI003A976355